MPMLTDSPNDRSASEAAIQSAFRTLKTEQAGLTALQEALANGLSQPFSQAVSTLSGLSGRVIVTGVGKSGHIGTKIAATLASTGTPAFFVHPSEANHGDLGMIAAGDVVLALSWSGETTELKGIVAYAKRFAIPLIAMTSVKSSALARQADIVLALPRVAEACPHGLAPTTSTLMQLALGDSLAVALLEARGFTTDHFRTFHPGGQLGANLVKAAEIMHSGDELPLVRLGTSMREAILEISRKSFGCVAVIDEQDRLCGIITDGDLRRHMEAGILDKSVDEVMTADPKRVAPDMLAAEVLQIINASSITAALVVEDERLVGIVHMHDLLRIGVA